MTAVPIHTVVTTPSSSTPPSHATPATPQPPGAPQADPGAAKDQQHAQQDSLDDIRADLDHYPGGLSEPDPTDQQALADAVPHNEDGTPERFPDPFGPWTQLQNDGGNEVPGRSNNCADCSRSFLETWYGDPQVSAPRTLDTDEHGNPDPWSPEANANANQIRWTGAAHTYAGPGNNPDTANNIASVLQQAGPGSAAIVQVDWPGGGGHAFNAVNHNGNIIWIDTQSGEVSHDPLHLDNAAHVWHIPLDADRNPIDLTQPAAEDSGGQSDGSQNQQGDASQPEKSETSQTSENNGQPENHASGDTAKQGDDTEAGATSRTQADPATPDASNDADSAQPSTRDPNASPDPTSGEPANDNGRPESESSKPTEPDSRPEGRKASQNTPEGQQPSTHTTPDATDNSTPPTRSATDTPNDPTTNRDTPQQTTTPSDPRTSVPHQQTADPRTADPRTVDPRATDPRTSDPSTSDSRKPDNPRTSDPHRDTPTQQKPETNEERPDARHPSTPPHPDQTHPDHVDDPRSDTPDRDRPETPDPTRPDDPNQQPTDNRTGRSDDRPSDMTKDSAVPKRESLPDGRNADAAGYVKDASAGKKPLYGDIAPENPTQTSRPTHPERPSGPEVPAGSSPNASDPESRRQRDVAMLARANSKDPKDRDWFEKHYWPKSGYRRSRTAPAEDGRPVPQLHPTGDPNAPWMLANDTPDAEPEEYITEGSRSGERNTEISDENLQRLDEAAKARQQAIDADRQPHRDRKAAKDAYEADKTPENRQKFEEADAKHSPLHGKMTRASEDYGEAVAEFHAMPRHFPDHARIDDRATGNNRFDQIWVDPNTDPPEFVVVEAKGSAQADLGDRRGIPPVGEAGGTDTPQNIGQDQNDSNAADDQPAQDDPRPGAAKVRQGTRAYFETILHEMTSRSMRVLNDPKATAAQIQAAADEARLTQQLRTALEEGRVKYVLVKGHSDGERHNGYEMHQFDIRTQEEKDADNAQDPEA